MLCILHIFKIYILNWTDPVPDPDHVRILVEGRIRVNSTRIRIPALTYSVNRQIDFYVERES